MSNFTGHLVGGTITASACAFTAYHFAASPAVTAGAFGACLGFSLFPDVDVKSVPSRIFYGVLFSAMIFLYWKRMFREGMLAGILGLLPQLVVHRGFFHSLAASIFIPAVILLTYGMIGMWSYVLWVCGFVGYSTHRLQDEMLFKL